MATVYQNLSTYDFDSVPDASDMSFGIVVAEWNKNITEKLLEGACNTLEKHGVKPDHIMVKRVPGSFELTFGAKKMAESKDLNAIIILGCVVRGDTPHFDYVCSGVTQGNYDYEGREEEIFCVIRKRQRKHRIRSWGNCFPIGTVYRKQ